MITKLEAEHGKKQKEPVVVYVSERAGGVGADIHLQQGHCRRRPKGSPLQRFSGGNSRRTHGRGADYGKDVAGSPERGETELGPTGPRAYAEGHALAGDGRDDAAKGTGCTRGEILGTHGY